jgi:two-component system, NtrC family, sensor kinase
MNEMAAQLATAHDRIEEESAARVAALEALRHADRLRTVGQLASALAHELGTPLNVVSGHARLIERGNDPAEAKQSARLIVEQTVRMTGLIKSLLGFSRRRGAERKPVPLRDVAEKAVRMLEPMSRKRDLNFEIVEQDADCVALADENQLLQAITNLVVNALQASPEHALVKLGIGRERTKAAPELGGREADYVRIAVEDQGAGVPLELLEKLFEPFFTTKPDDEGTGLGLPVTQGIARDHGGWVAVESRPGCGSRFTVYLPAAATA